MLVYTVLSEPCSIVGLATFDTVVKKGVCVRDHAPTDDEGELTSSPSPRSTTQTGGYHAQPLTPLTTTLDSAPLAHLI